MRTVAPDSLAPSWAVTVPISETVADDGAVGVLLPPQLESRRSAKRIARVRGVVLISGAVAIMHRSRRSTRKSFTCRLTYQQRKGARVLPA
jgi:hypothetical protein